MHREHVGFFGAFAATVPIRTNRQIPQDVPRCGASTRLWMKCCSAFRRSHESCDRWPGSIRDDHGMAARLEVIVGPMFSGKTELLIARLHRVLYAKKRLRIIKPAHDTRTQGFIASRAVNPDGTTEVTDTLSATMVRNEADFAR